VRTAVDEHSSAQLLTSTTQSHNIPTLSFNTLFEQQNKQSDQFQSQSAQAPLQPMLTAETFNLFDQNANRSLQPQQGSLFIDQGPYTQPSPASSRQLVDMMLQQQTSTQTAGQQLVNMMMQPETSMHSSSQQLVDMMIPPAEIANNSAMPHIRHASPLPSPMLGISNPLITSLINAAGSASPLLSSAESNCSDVEEAVPEAEAYGNDTPTLAELEQEIFAATFDSTSNCPDTESFEKSVSALATICRYKFF
jgi:hypothetical protein